ncbi:type III secretion HpaP family protein [Candidatus Sororendozoicomonas aggregata]|uniref:type III secretion HpaP family protein n=1 Tax=Candidatus Sororendozoicomonas aggregata TaxID=3073239 RepID=UPI002ED5DE28
MHVDQSPNTEQNKPSVDNQTQQQPNERVSQEESNRFSKELKKKEPKKKPEETEEASLETLLAEQRRLEKDISEQKKRMGEGGTGGQQHQGSENQRSPSEMMLSHMQELQLQTSLSAQELQLQSDIKLQALQQTKSIKEVEAALQKMADQIQVSAKDAVNGAEMRITMKDTVLQGTEIRVHRHAGELTVTMNTTSAETHNLLAQHQASLQKHLDERFTGENVQISFNMAGDDGDNEEGSAQNEYATEEETNDEKPTSA